jgi:hypothetical protein
VDILCIAPGRFCYWVVLWQSIANIVSAGYCFAGIAIFRIFPDKKVMALPFHNDSGSCFFPQQRL